MPQETLSRAKKGEIYQGKYVYLVYLAALFSKYSGVQLKIEDILTEK